VITALKSPYYHTDSKFLFECGVITAINVFWLGVVLYGVLRANARNKLQDA
jgi:hypothetical protein